MPKILKTLTYLIFSTVALSYQAQAQEEDFSCLEDTYSYNQCKFDLPQIENGDSKVVSSDTGLFEGRLLVLCNNGKKSIISESCNYAQGAVDSCKGIPSNSWTGEKGDMCSHSYISTSVPNGDDFKVNSINNNGFVTYECNDTKLKVKKMDCENPDRNQILTTQSTSIQCNVNIYTSQLVYDFLKSEYVAVPPNDSYCVNEGKEFLQSFALITQNEVSETATYSAVCCSNDTLDSPPQETIITKINSDCSNIQTIMTGEFNEITGEYSNNPSNNNILNNVCRPNGFTEVKNSSVGSLVIDSITYADEFEVEAVCCGNVIIGEENTDCKGQFIGSGATAELDAKALGIPYICDSSTGSMECYTNSCTPFVQPAELCADCDLGNYIFNLNSNTCTTNMPVIYSGHDTIEDFYNDTHSGYIEVSCMNGGELIEDGRCFRNCLSTTVSWQNESGSATCYDTLADTKYRHYLTPTDNDRNNPNMEIGDKTGRVISIVHTGIAEFHCDDGQWTENSEDLEQPLCFANCTAETGRWGTGYSKDGRDKTNACSSNLGATRHYVRPNYTATDPMSNPSYDTNTSVSTSGALGSHVGAAEFRCNDGLFEISGAQTCNLDCQAQNVSWTRNGTTASANVGASKHGSYLYNVIATGVNAGQGNTDRNWSSVTDLVCDDGRYVSISTDPRGPWKDCPSGSTIVNSPNYSNSCSFSWGGSSHGDTGSLSAGGNGSGGANYICRDGNIELSNMVCNRNCSTNIVEWPRTSGISSNCPSGFTQSGSQCNKITNVAPICPSGFSYVTSSNQCERSNGIVDTYPALPACQGSYSDYSEDGYTCEKEYTTAPSCPFGWIFNGTDCENPSSSSTTATWTCPSTSVAPSNPSGANAGSWNYQSLYTEITTTEINGNCPSGYTFDSNTGMCTSPCPETCDVGLYDQSEFSEYGTWETEQENWSVYGLGDLYTRESDSRDSSGGSEYMRPGARFVSGGIQYGGYFYYPGVLEYSGSNYGSAEYGELCRQDDSVLSGNCGSTVTPTCPSGYLLQSNGRCREEATRTNVCTRDITITPSCDDGYSWNGSQCEGTANSSIPNYTCNQDSGVNYQGIYDADQLRSLTGQNLDCGGAGECCLYGDNNCNVDTSGGFNPELKVCFWVALPPNATCPSGTTLVGNSCQAQSLKTGNCPIGFVLSGNMCREVDVIDANETCPDGSTAPCEFKPSADAICNPVSLDTGSSAIPTLQSSYCKYTHTVPNAATATCPSGGSSTGSICYVNGTDVETEIPVCSNGGTLNNSTDRCEATETVPAQSGEPVTCSTTASSRTHSGTRGLTDSSTNGATGNASVRCNDGNWIVSSASCYKDCSSTISAGSVTPGSLEWSTGDSLSSSHPAFGLNCSHSPVSVSSYGHNADRNNITTLQPEKLVGQINYTCDDGFWDVAASSCTRQSCTNTTAGSTVSWTKSSTCNVSTPSGLRWGDETTLNQPYGYSGSVDATVLCVDNGVINLQNSSTVQCFRDCNGSIGTGYGFNWSESSNSCYAAYSSYISHGNGNIRILDTTGSARGDNYIKCNNGSVSFDNSGSPDCHKLTPSGTFVQWNASNGTNGSTGSCVGTLPSNIMLSGGTIDGTSDCVNVSSTTFNYSGTATFCATTSGVIKTSGSCVLSVCSGKSVSWSQGGRSCSSSVSTEIEGVTLNVSNTAALKTGSASFKCETGNWNIQSGAICNTDCPSGNTSWGSGNCTATNPSNKTHGSSSSVTNNSSGYSGSATLTCNNNIWQVSDETCIQDAPAGCPNVFLNWPSENSGIDCGATSGIGVESETKSINTFDSTNDGFAIITCSNGIWNINATSCENCGGTSDEICK
jgi:hypothetical protein